jgi:hypothetical protein
VLVEDFDAGIATTGAIGRNGWVLNLLNTGAGASIASESQHPGIYRLSTGATSGSVAGLYLNNGPYIDDLNELEIVFRIGAITTAQYGFYFADTIGIVTNVVGIIFDTAALHTSWHVWKEVAGVGGYSTDIVTVVAANEWYYARFKRTGSGALDVTVRRTSDGSSGTVSVTGLTLTAYSTPQFRAVNSAAANRTMDADYYRCDSSVLTRF